MCTGNPKSYEASVALTELSLDNSFIKSALIQMNNVWIIRGSNIPHPWDLGVPNPGKITCIPAVLLYHT